MTDNYYSGVCLVARNSLGIPFVPPRKLPVSYLHSTHSRPRKRSGSFSGWSCHFGKAINFKYFSRTQAMEEFLLI